MAPRLGLAARVAGALGNALRAALPQTAAAPAAPSLLPRGCAPWAATRGFFAVAGPLPPALRAPQRQLGGFAAAAAGQQPWAGLRGFAARSSTPSLKVHKPTSPGQRGRVTTTRKGLHKGKPMRGLTMGMAKTGGRNNHGRITSRHRGGGARKLYRIIQFKRPLDGSRCVVQRLEYDPNRSARIALLEYEMSPEAAAAAATGPPRPKYANFAYIVAPDGIKAGDTLTSGPGVSILPGNAMALRDIPIGTLIHNIEMRPGGGGKLVRAAGTSATLVKKGDDGYATVRLASGETRLLRADCAATVGVVGNKEHHNRKIGKAGIARHMGRRPHVRGVAMNPVDHPHGGGEGKSSGGRPSVTPWAMPTKGYRTRNNKRTDRWIVEKRHGRGK